MKKVDYALYKGDDFLTVGSVQELSEYLNVKPETVRFFSYPSYLKRFSDDNNRLIVIKIEDGSD